MLRDSSGKNIAREASMRFARTCFESLGYLLPPEIVTSEQIEDRLSPLYERLRLPAGRLELMTGIRERRLWEPGTLPGDKSILSCESALAAAGIDRRWIGALVHGSVCRDHLEPATACRVHHALGLEPGCLVYDVSNACLGLLTGALQVASWIESRQIRAGLVVGTEDSRSLLETTIHMLSTQQSLSRNDIKLAIASLTIGSGSCAMLLVDEQLSRTGNRLHSATARANTAHHALCQSGRDEAIASGMQPLMNTDSETLMREGIATGVATFEPFLQEAEWQRADLARVFCHQVGSAHRRLLLDSLQIPLERDFATFPWLGNTGSVALPTTLAIGCQSGQVARGDRLALLGIGSGINCLMMSVEWHESRIGAA
jgi:3-oxoacyl-[acyl-carrier-protein] synthase-3